MNIRYIDPQEKYTRSYWEALDGIIRERIYLARSAVFPYESTVAFMRNSIERGIPFVLAIDFETDEVVGWCDAQVSMDKVGNLGIGVRRAYRGMGIGRRLLAETMRRAKKFGYRQIDLEVRGSNRRAIALYKNFGFRHVRTVENGLVLDGMVDDVVVMRRRISPHARWEPPL